jgi:hypothetical protein
MIDWNLLFRNFNDEYNTEFTSICELLKVLYEKTKSTMTMCDILMVSHHTLRKKMVWCDISIAKRGGPNYKGVFKEIILNTPKEHFKNMTAKEIAQELGCKHNHVRNVMRKNNIEYKKLPGGRPCQLT